MPQSVMRCLAYFECCISPNEKMLAASTASAFAFDNTRQGDPVTHTARSDNGYVNGLTDRARLRPRSKTISYYRHDPYCV